MASETVDEIIQPKSSQINESSTRRASQKQVGKASVMQKTNLTKNAGLDKSMNSTALSSSSAHENSRRPQSNERRGVVHANSTSSEEEVLESSHRRTLKQSSGASTQKEQAQTSSQHHDDDQDDEQDDDDVDVDDVLSRDNSPSECRPYACPVCDRRYTQLAFLNVHMDIHNYEKQFKCDICAQSFWAKCDLFHHKETHSGRVTSPGISAPENPTKLSGEAKGSGSSTREKKVRDSKLNQKGDGREDSRHVESNPASSKNLRNTPQASKTYSCAECYKTFSTNSNLNVHMKIHSGERPFKCYLCDKDFYRNADLTKHLRIHSGEKPYQCDICKETFRQKNQIKQHMSIHVQG